MSCFTDLRGFVTSTLILASWLSVGNLDNGGNAGLWYVNANNGLTNANWNIGGRESGRHL
jgi:hypothetical protein